MSAVSFALVSLALLLNGCALTPKYIAPNYVPPQKVAVLPMANQSNDVRAPEFVRTMFMGRIQSRGYTVVSKDDVDKTLREKFGINEGGQLGTVPPEKIGTALGADALIYGDILEFKFLNIGIYQNKTVKADFKMMDAKSGNALWEDVRRSSEKQIASLQNAGKAFAAGVAEKAIGNMFNSPLAAQVQVVVNQAVSTLPRAK